MGDASVTPILGKIELAADDLVLLQRALDLIAEVQTLLGAEHERHSNMVEHLGQQLKRARSAYLTIADALSNKYVKRPGQYVFRPDLGAFVGRNEAAAIGNSNSNRDLDLDRVSKEQT